MFTINDLPGLGGRLTFPRTGAWQAEIRIDTDQDLSGALIINVDDGRLTLKGTVDRGGNWQNVDALRIVGGAGGLRTVATPKHYTTATVGVVLRDLLADAGETLSATSYADTLGASLTSWTTSALSTGNLISLVLRAGAPGANWRVLPDGTVWVGVERWPDAGLVEGEDYHVLTEDPQRLFARLGVEVPLLMPGTALGGRRVSYVEHLLEEPQTRTEVWFESAAGAGAQDRIRAALKGLVAGAAPGIEYSSLIWAEIVAQNGGTIDVRPVDRTRPPMAQVPLLAGIAKWAMQLQPGGRVLVGWGSADPSQAYVVGFSPDVAASSLTIECPDVTIGNAGGTVVIGDPSTAQANILSTPYRAAEDAYLDAIVVGLQAALSSLTLVSEAAALTAAQVAFKAASQTFLSQLVKVS